MTNENKTNEIKETTATEVQQTSLSDNARVISPGQLVLRRFFRSKLSLIGLAMLIVMCVFCFIGPLFATWEEAEIDYTKVTTYDYKEIVVKDANGNEYVVYCDYEMEEYRSVSLEMICDALYGDGQITADNISYQNVVTFRKED